MTKPAPRHSSFYGYLKYTSAVTNRGHYGIMARAVRKGFHFAVIDKMRKEENISDDLRDFAECLHDDYKASQSFQPTDKCLASAGWDGMGDGSGGHSRRKHLCGGG